MLSANYNPFDNSLNNARTLVGLQWLYEGFKEQLGKFLLVLLVMVLGFPFAVFMGYSFKRKRKKFQAHMKKVMPLFHNASHYVDYKSQLEGLRSLSPGLKKVAAYNVKKAPWPLNYTLREMQKMSSTLITFDGWLESKSDYLNVEQYSSEAKVFKFVSEEELWNKRNKAYQYWM